MKINKQLFEDVLSGKLKGIFVLRNGDILTSKYLKRTNDTSFLHHSGYHYYLDELSYTENGDRNMNRTCCLDIIDFIPVTNMKQNELTIEIPEGKIVDWEESKKQNKIVLKNKRVTYENVCEKLLGNNFYYINSNGCIAYDASRYTPNCAKTKHQLECILAKNKLANVAKYLNDGWSDGWTLAECNHATYLTLNNMGNIVCRRIHSDYVYAQVMFKTKELAQQAIEILGKETVKLALEPLGI